MATLKLEEHGWVVVCDGRKALILENVGDAEYPDLRTRDAVERVDAPTRELGTDAPGRVQESAASMRSAIEPTDWHDRAEEQFLVELAARLDKALPDVPAFVIIAPPRALGMIRKVYSNRLRQAIVAEIDKDLVALPADEIERRIFGKRKR